jgi:hypothetical protein
MRRVTQILRYAQKDSESFPLPLRFSALVFSRCSFRNITVAYPSTLRFPPGRYARIKNAGGACPGVEEGKGE